MTMHFGHDGTVLAEWTDAQGKEASTYTGNWKAKKGNLATVHTDGGEDGTAELVDARRLKLVGGNTVVVLRRIE
jgi:hypothetical protein